MKTTTGLFLLALATVSVQANAISHKTTANLIQPTAVTLDSVSVRQKASAELAFFSASLSENSIDLNWATASELNIDNFDVQRSSDGISFESIAHVKAHGTSNQELEYAYTDKSPKAGNNYYRIMAVDGNNYRQTFDIVWQYYAASK